MELVKLDHKEFGVDESKAKQISSVFKPMLDKMEELETEYNEIVSLEVTPETSEKAKELRLKYVKVRTGTAEIHKEQKAFYRSGGLFVDGWKNAQIFASQGIEQKLMDIEKHQENIEKERLVKVRESRLVELSKFGRENDPVDVQLMDDDVWNNYLLGVQLSFKQLKEADEKAEKERLEKERLDSLENERRIEVAPFVQFITGNNDLRSMSLDDYNSFLNNLKKAKADHELEQEKVRKENEALRKQAEQQEKEKAKEKAKQDAILEVERKKKAELESQLKAKEEAEKKAKSDEEARIEAELKAGDSDKLEMLISDLNTLKSKYIFKSKKNQKLYLEVSTLLDKVVTHINK